MVIGSTSWGTLVLGPRQFFLKKIDLNVARTSYLIELTLDLMWPVALARVFIMFWVLERIDDFVT